MEKLEKLDLISGAVLVLILLSGCFAFQNSPEPKTAIEDITSPGVFTVNFCGNDYMSADQVEKYALKRASETALSKGYTHFAVLEKRDDSQVCELGSKEYYDQPQVDQEENPFPKPETKFKRPNMTLIIKCFYKGQGVPAEAIDAQGYLRENFPGATD